MIGAFLSAYFVGKKPLTVALTFWLVMMLVGWIIVAATYTMGILGTILNLIVGIAIFISFAIFYLKVDINKAIILYVVSLVINVLLGLISGLAFGLADVTYMMQLIS